MVPFQALPILIWGSNHTVPTTGTFDTTLKNAVVEFQKKHHLDADGVVGQGTLAALENTKAYTAWLSNGKVSLTAGLLAECGFSGYILGFGVTELNTALNSFNINTKEKVRHFLAQCMYETYNGTLVAEVGYEAGVGGSKSYSPYYGAGYLHLTSKASYYSDPAPLNFYDYLKNTAKITDDKVKTPAAYATQHVAIKYPGRSAGWVWDKLKNINSSSVINWNSDSTTICTAITKLISGSSSTASDRHKNYADKICPILK